MTATDISHDAEADVDAAADSHVIQQANEEAKQIVAKSRYEAFRLVTEARGEAETILDEARSEAAGTKRAAEITAESKLDAADLRVAEIIEKAERRAAVILAEATESVIAEPLSLTETAALEAEHDELSERVGSLRVLADQLERRFAALAASAPSVVAPSQRSEEGTSETAPVCLDYSPSVAPKQKDPQSEIAPAEDDADHRSFYSRRSAKLPRIGEAAGKSALDMTRTIRRKLETDRTEIR